MSVITESSEFSTTIRQIDDQEIITEALLNAAAQNLTNRTKFLYDAITTGGMKIPVAAATTENIDLSGNKSIDGVSVTAGAYVLVKDQSAPSANGIYVAAVGNWTRRFDNAESADMNGAVVTIVSGTVNGGSIWKQTTQNPNVGVSAITWTKIYPHSFSNLVDKPTTVAGYAISDMGIYSPPGAVTAFAGSSAPPGWFECKGQAISKTTYSALYEALDNGAIYGQAETTFNLPNLQGEFIRGWDNGRHIDDGRVVGSFQADAFEAHSHTGMNSAQGPEYGTDWYAGTYTVSAGSTGTTGDTETRPRNIAMMYIIKY